MVINLRLAKTLASAALFGMGAAHALEPIPGFYQEPGLSPNRDYVNQQMHEHIDPFTGKLQLHYVDLFVPGNGGLDIKVQRSYNSQNELLTEPTVLGVGWTMHFGRVLRRSIIDICATNLNASNAPVLELPDGSRQILYLSPDQTFLITTNRFKAVCGGTGLIVSSPDGTRYEMTTPGLPTPAGASPTTQQNSYYTTRIVDRNGNALNFTYTTVGAITTVSRITSGDGRTVTFNYSGGTLSSVTDGLRTWGYEYNASIANFPFLTKVTRPDGQSWSYAYNLAQGASAGVFSMNKLVYPTGGEIDYLYGFTQFNDNLPRTTVVTQKTGLGSVWTFSYNPATKVGNFVNDSYQFVEDAMMDRTFVSGPDGVHKYMHIGANSVNSGGVYSIGLLLHESVDGGYQNVGHVWDVQVVSDMINQRPGAAWITDAVIGAPVPFKTTIVRNGQSYTTTYDNYDDFGNPQTITEQGTTTNGIPDSRTTQRSYNVLTGKWILHLPKDDIISTTGTINRLYDGNGNLLSENKYGVTTQFTYTAEGDIASKQDARTNTINYSSYKRGIPQSEVHPEGVTITRSVDDSGNVTSQTDGEGATTSYGYDGLNRLTSIVHPVGNPVSITWGANARVVQRGSYREFMTFDSYGRNDTTQVDGGASGSIIQRHQYDAINRRIFSSYFNQTVGTAYLYDALGRVFLTRNIAVGPSGSFTGGQRSSFFNSNRVLNVNERGILYEMDYRGYGDPDRLDLVKIVAPDPAANVDITRNGLGQPLTVTQAGLTRSNTYDTRFFLNQAVNPETGITLYGRDAVGNMTSRKVGSSGLTTYGYDGRNRLTSILYPAGTPSVTKTYFRDDLMKSADNGLARRDYLYSPNKKLTHEALTAGTTVLSVDYTYDGNDALSTMTYGTGLTVNYLPDGLGRPTQVTPFANSIAFHPNGLLKQIRYGNGLVSDFAINDRQWPSNLALAKPDGSGALNITNLYDFSGNVTNITEAVQHQQDRVLGYDPLDRLSSVSMPGVVGGVISYDGSGNIVSQALGSTATFGYQYDATNKLTSIAGSRNQSFAYDVYGNVSSNGRNQFQYDDASAMRCVDCGTPNEIRYVYDGQSTRVSEQKGTFTTYFMYGSSGNLLFEVDSNGVKREYGYVADRNIGRKVSQ